MAHHEGFLRDIIEHPEDDAPRLIYADWLDELGLAERGEFIRVQCALAGQPWRVGRVYDDPAWLRLYARERELLTDVNRWRWLGLCGHPGDDFFVTFRRGFVAEVTLPCDQWMRHGPALVRAAPLERVTLSDRRPAEHGRYFAWYGYAPPGFLSGSPPSLLYDLLTGGVPSAPQGLMREYHSAAEAYDDLSRACLKWARKPAPAAR
jgi:uncharacterized protein (TIGR02996 family)